MKIVEVTNDHGHELITDPVKVKNWLYDRRLESQATIDDDGVVWKSTVDMSGIGAKSIGVQFGKEINYFYVDNNNLTSLKGSPEEVIQNFSCNNNNLKTLKYAPKIVHNEFNCSNNKLTSLEFGPHTTRVYDCNHNDLTSLYGAPEECHEFNGSLNLLTSLEHAPKRLKHSLFLNYNKFTSLAGIHKHVLECKRITLSGNKIDGPILGLLLISGLAEIIAHPNHQSKDGHSKDFQDAVTIVNKHLGKGRAGVLSAQDELQEHNLDRFAEL